MSCFDCQVAQILPKPEDHGFYSVYGYCRKDIGQAYPIYVPEAVCRYRKLKKGVDTP